MVTLKITNKNGYEYQLRDEEGRDYTFNFEFWDLEDEPEVGDELFVSRELLTENASYTFGSLESKYGKENVELGDQDVIKVRSGEKETVLKRLYG